MTEFEPQRECPRWDKCSVNHCPLDPFQDDRLSDPADKEQKCTIAKTIRVRIGSKYPDLLPMGGLKPSEHAAAKRFANLSVAARAELAKKGREALIRHSKDKSTKTNDV